MVARWRGPFASGAAVPTRSLSRRSSEVPARLADVVQDGDVVITQGAGDVGRLACWI